MNLTVIKSIYFVGVGGIGTSALARFFHAQGKQVSGSDLRESSITQELSQLGIKVHIGHSEQNIREMPDLAIYSIDVSSESAGFVELEHLKDHNVPLLPYAEVLGLLMDEKKGVAVTGTNGKSTTSAMLALILERAGFDPSVIIGTKISIINESTKFKANARLGDGEYFVAESDEYHRKMLFNHPKAIVITNIAEDHLDYYKDLSDIKNAFLEYVKALPQDGMVVYNADDHNTVEVARQAQCHKYTFGIKHYADLQALNIKTEHGMQTFDLHLQDEKIGTFSLKVPGKYNVSNALGATLAALKLGVDINVIRQVLFEFAGTWRRFETVGKFQGKPVISDYGHHPAALYGVIEAAKEFYPGQKILFVFQPHHRNRTKKLLGEFVEALASADHLILPEIFDVAGREHGENISSKDIADMLTAKGVNASYARDLSQTENMIRKQADKFDVILMIGAGDIDSLARKLIQ